MVIPSPWPLAESLRRLRRTYAAIFAVVVVLFGARVGAGLYARQHPDTYEAVRDLSYLGTGLLILAGCVVMLTYYLVKGRHRVLTTEMLVSTVDGEPAFVVPAALQRWSSMLFGLPTGLSIQLSTEFLVVAAGKADERNVIGIGIWTTVIVLLLGLYLLGVRRGSQRLVLTSAGVRVPTVLGSRFVAWDELAPGGPWRPASKRIPILLRFHSKPVELRFFSPLVRADFVADLLRFYVEHPAQRPVIGTADEYARIQVTASLELSNA